jgi:hypothetical protein
MTTSSELGVKEEEEEREERRRREETRARDALRVASAVEAAARLGRWERGVWRVCEGWLEASRSSDLKRFFGGINIAGSSCKCLRGRGRKGGSEESWLESLLACLGMLSPASGPSWWHDERRSGLGVCDRGHR